MIYDVNSPLFRSFLSQKVLLTVSPNLVLENWSTELSESKVSFALGAYQAVVEKLRSKVNEDVNHKEINQFEELEVYKIVFDTSNIDFGEHLIEDSEPEVEKNCLASIETQVSAKVEKNSVVITRLESSESIMEEKRLGVSMHQKNKFEEFSRQKEEKEVKPLSENSNKVEEQKEEMYISGSKALSHLLSDSKVSGNDDDNREYISRMNSQRSETNSWSPEYNSKVADNYQTMGSNLGSFGSMRKEKEWRRTLACKLFEERHNADGGEGMDSLWETYETDSIKLQAKSKSKKGKKGSMENYYNGENEEEEEEDESNAQLCCLQALKFSAGKMNLGMGRPNLVKISKALKGIGWLHNVTKHGKKSYY
ncbi:hypothetical protein JCGZ_17511 [Jatropha curcas]|uniref:Uncharacterized protein n=1 Tax=Jatropha curcas TaxID=180498 RepID=A0A067JU80_JATCU|nr:hypothetical protein JCGZ_17511 [Jatropha curcas]